MSIAVMTQVWKHAPYSEGTLLTLLALADWSDDEGMCWPSISQIADKARLSESGAKFTIKRLIDDGAITKVEQGYGRGHRSRYQISSQYLTPSERIKGSVKEEKGVSNPSANKEEPSLEPSVLSLTLSEGKSSNNGSHKTGDPRYRKPVDSRYTLFVEALESGYKRKNWQFSFGTRDGNQLKILLKSRPKWEVANFRKALTNYFASEKVVPGDLPYVYLAKLPRYEHGPLNEFGKLLVSKEVKPVEDTTYHA